MRDPVDALVLDLVEWIGTAERPYAEIIETWRTSCPRLPVWEEANARGYIDLHFDHERGRTVRLSELGLKRLQTTLSERLVDRAVETL